MNVNAHTQTCIITQSLSHLLNVSSPDVPDYTFIADWDQLLPWWSHHWHKWIHYTRFTVISSLTM